MHVEITLMIRFALTELALLGVAIWLGGLNGREPLGSTLVLIAVFLVIGALFFCVLGAIS